MLCQHCNRNNATTHIKKNINGNKEELYLCNECAEKLGVMEDFRMPSFEELLGDSLLGTLLGNSSAAQNALAGIDRCSTCGASYNDIVSSGHIGCSDCYGKFSERLDPSIRKIHGKTKHLGKFISYTQKEEPKKSKVQEENPLEALKKELKTAIEEQRFEDAAALRDKIKELEGGNE